MARDGRGCERKCASRTKMTQNWSGGMSRARATRMARATGVSVDAGRAEEWVTRKGGSRTGRRKSLKERSGRKGRTERGPTRKRRESAVVLPVLGAAAGAALWVWHTGTRCLSFLALCCLCTRPGTGHWTSQSQKDGSRRTGQSATPPPLPPKPGKSWRRRMAT